MIIHKGTLPLAINRKITGTHKRPHHYMHMLNLSNIGGFVCNYWYIFYFMPINSHEICLKHLSTFMITRKGTEARGKWPYVNWFVKTHSSIKHIPCPRPFRLGKSISIYTIWRACLGFISFTFYIYLVYICSERISDYIYPQPGVEMWSCKTANDAFNTHHQAVHQRIYLRVTLMGPTANLRHTQANTHMSKYNLARVYC